MDIDKVGNGLKLTFNSELLVTGDNDLPNIFTVFCQDDFPTLVFLLDSTDMFDFDVDTGIFTFKQTGHLQILATMNFGTTGVSEVQISPAFKRGLDPWAFLNARRASLPVIGQNHVFMSGSVNIQKGDLMRFELKATNNQAAFNTEALSNASVIPAAIIDFRLLIR